MCAERFRLKKGREFLNDDYKNIKKVYTIWICPKSEEEWKRGTITRYYPQEECLVGQTREKKENYDLFEIRMIYLPAEEGKKGSGILRMLDKLLSPVTTREDKLDSLKNDFGVAITKQIERKVDAMCDYSTVVLNNGIEMGEEKKAKETALNLYEMKMTPEDIAKAVKYPLAVVKKWLGLIHA